MKPLSGRPVFLIGMCIHHLIPDVSALQFGEPEVCFSTFDRYTSAVLEAVMDPPPIAQAGA